MDQILDLPVTDLTVSPFLDAMNIDCSSTDAFLSSLDPLLGHANLRDLLNPSYICDPFLSYANDLSVSNLILLISYLQFCYNPTQSIINHLFLRCLR